MKNVIAGMVAVFVVASSSAGCQGCDEDYSNGRRMGTVVKLSRKGIYRKSWEGTLHLGATRDSATGANVWDFSVTDEKTIKQVQEAFQRGAPVEVLYREWYVGPWYIDSNHVVLQVTSK